MVAADLDRGEKVAQKLMAAEMVRLGPNAPFDSARRKCQARAIFKRAIERGNLLVAEVTAREVGPLDLSEALELTALVALRNRERSQRFAVRWLARWIEETEPTLEEVVMVAGCLAALGGPGHAAALEALRAAAG